MEEIKVQVIKPTKTLLDSSRDTSEKLKVCAYCRVSTKDEEQKESFRNQIKYYTDLIKSHKEWKNAGIYADEGISRTRDDKRPQFMQMIQDAMEGKINIILVKSLSRFSRNTVDLLNYVRALREKKACQQRYVVPASRGPSPWTSSTPRIFRVLLVIVLRWHTNSS